MRLLPASLAIGFVLVASLSTKFMAPAASNDPGLDQNNRAVIAALDGLGFSTELDGGWVLGTRGACRLHVADVEPQGWTRSSIQRAAAGNPIHYAFAGQLYDEQPILRTSSAYYRRRLLAYFHIKTSPKFARAIVVANTCPSEVIDEIKLLAARI
ncbi:hypothetical protein [Aliihoeflea sp. 40Bstr573]|uniref:hypothetical protein n=1 Tax=Aliihoeflea sp. 40Bstr573 TaxID=2696467 RepID=UPI00209404B4|nr:hypothetical protein [Aliihoeflea sp. 40Bstr573]MCO6388414.1 hypothetical protein [Aliihoeflea sp. 40Bstr573]